MAENDPDPIPEDSSDGTTSAVVIRATRPTDAEALARLGNLPGVRWGSLRLPFESEEAWRNRIDRMMHQATSLVAEIGGRLVGTAGLHRSEGRRSHVGSLGMMVDDAFVRRGIGTALLAAQVDLSDNWLNLVRLDLTVYVDNAAAIALYEKFGFVIEGRHRAYAYRAGAYVDAFTMARIGHRPAPDLHPA